MDRQHNLERIDRQFQGLLTPRPGCRPWHCFGTASTARIVRAHRVGKSVLVAWIELTIPEAVESRAFVGDVVERLRSSLRIDDTIARVGLANWSSCATTYPAAETVPGIIERLVKTNHPPLTIAGHDARIISRLGVVLDEGSTRPATTPRASTRGDARRRTRAAT